MAKFLTASATTYHLEALMQNTTEQLTIVTPTLKFNERVQELLAQRDSEQAATHIIYKQNHLQPEEMHWLNSLDLLSMSFCKNLQAQCYLNDSQAIITSLQLHAIGQEQHNEMGVLIHRDTDTELYLETNDEVQRLINIGEPVRITVERLTMADGDFGRDLAQSSSNSFKSNAASQPKASKNTVAKKSNKVDDEAKAPNTQKPTGQPIDKSGDKEDAKVGEVLATAAKKSAAEQDKESANATTETAPDKLTTAKLAKSLGLKTPELKGKLTELGYLQEINGELMLSEAGRKMGGESRKGRFGEFCVWDAKMQI